MPTLGLAMIVKNGAQTLRRCLESVAGLVDAIVIADTGSTDETVSIARDFGATVLVIPWTNDFSEVRNAVLRHMETGWVLVLDADEEITEEARAWIRSAMTGSDRPAAYYIQVRNYISPRVQPPIDQIMLPPGEQHPHAPDAVAYVPSAAIRLFRRDPDIFYRGCVHEMVEHQVNALGREVRAGGFLIHHFGPYLADARQTRQKRELHFRLLSRKLSQMPNDTNTLVRYASMLFRDYSKPEEALAHLKRAAEIDDAAPLAWLWTGDILTRLGRFEEALVALKRAPQDDSPSLRTHLTGDCLVGLERFSEARTAYEDALAMAPLDRIVGSKLGLIEVRLGQTREGVARIEAAARAGLPLEEVDQRLAEAYMTAGMIPEGLSATEQLARAYGRPAAWLEMARFHAQRGQWWRALQTLDSGIEQLPGVLDLHTLRTKAAIALEDWPAAVTAARRVAGLSPSADTLLRLAAILHHAGERAEMQHILSLREEYLAGVATVS
jgi:tetratricopeptide (TPR) repeat protein